MPATQQNTAANWVPEDLAPGQIGWHRDSGRTAERTTQQ